MNTTKKVLLTALVSTGLLAGGAVLACGGKHHDSGHKSERMMERKLNKLTKKLDLSEEQSAQMGTLMGERRERMKATMDAEHEKFKTAIEGVLTPEQLAEFEEIMEKRGGKHGDKRGDKKQGEGE